MKKLTGILFLILCSCLAGLSFGQEPFQQCAAAFLNKNMVVNEYTTSGKCVLPLTAQGELTVQTVDLSPTASKALDAIPFRIAIRDGQTKTLIQYASNDVLKADIRQVLAKCKKGDSIVLLTMDNQYALPHNEILIR
jgi:hypothetical protein